MKFYEAANDFLISRSYDRNISTRTANFNREALSAVGAIVEEICPECLDDVSLLDEDKLWAIIKHMQGFGLADRTICGRVNTLRVFIRYLSQKGIMRNTCEDIHFNVKQNEQLVPFSTMQIKAMFDVLDPENPLDVRGMALMMLLLDTGARISETSNLNIADIDLENQTVFFRERKNSKSGIMHFGKEARMAFEQYFHSFGIDAGDINNPLFQEPNGKRMSVRSMQRYIKQIGERAKIKNVRCSPHTFRHTFAINYLLNGGSMAALKIFLGHNSISTVMIYVKIAQEHGKELYKSAVDNMVLKTSIKLLPDKPNQPRQPLFQTNQ